MESVRQWIIERLLDDLDVSRLNFHPTGGGCIANAAKIESDDGRSWFLKYGTGDVADSLRSEAHGLKLLASAVHPLTVPDPMLLVDDSENNRVGLVLRWLEAETPNKTFWEKLGRGLAALHKYNQAERYGLDVSNFIGSTPQINEFSDSWRQFFVTRRLEPLVAMLKAMQRWNAGWDALLSGFLIQVDALLPGAPEASLLHGDLWSGNVLCHAKSEPALIDPAVYFGHRETDLAMSELFGGFDAAFYAAYREAWPLDAGYDDRKKIYNLYHELNHLLLFGSGYAGMVHNTLAFFA